MNKLTKYFAVRFIKLRRQFLQKFKKTILKLIKGNSQQFFKKQREHNRQCFNFVSINLYQCRKKVTYSKN